MGISLFTAGLGANVEFLGENASIIVGVGKHESSSACEEGSVFAWVIGGKYYANSTNEDSFYFGASVMPTASYSPCSGGTETYNGFHALVGYRWTFGLSVGIGGHILIDDVNPACAAALGECETSGGSIDLTYGFKF